MPRIDVLPEAFYRCGETVHADAFDPLVAGIDRLVAALGQCAAMAGADPGGVSWSGGYDRAARAVLAASADAANGLYRLVCVLEHTGHNHALAEAASTAGQADWHGGWFLHDPAYRFVAGAVPSASGGSGDTPPGWWLIQHTVGYVWPNGHQDRLRTAASAWRASAHACAESAAVVQTQAAVISDQRSPEVDDAVVVCSAMADHLSSLSRAHARLANGCAELADHLDQVHHEAVAELQSLLEWTAGIQAVGAVASVFTLGIAEAPTQAVEAGRIAVAAARVGAMIERFVALARTAAGALPGVAAAADSLRWSLDGLLGTRVAIAGVTTVRALPATARAAYLTEMSADERLAAGAALSGARTSEATAYWARPPTLAKHFRDHGRDFAAASEDEYAAQATAFLRRALLEGLPMKRANDGTIRVYDAATNTFGSYTESGLTKTFFKPTGRNYWQTQPGVPR